MAFGILMTGLCDRSPPAIVKLEFLLEFPLESLEWVGVESFTLAAKYVQSLFLPSSFVGVDAYAVRTSGPEYCFG